MLKCAAHVKIACSHAGHHIQLQILKLSTAILSSITDPLALVSEYALIRIAYYLDSCKDVCGTSEECSLGR